ncbi:MAG: hypothetical protein KC416_13575, partial [Myxococcales bacterium]|nr:hypothetical protein [Myxococcales bacterium]
MIAAPHAPGRGPRRSLWVPLVLLALSPFVEGATATAQGRPDPQPTQDERDTLAKIGVLEQDLQALSYRDGNQTLNGILSMVTGGVGITLGAVVNDARISPYLYVLGGVSVARGLASLVLSPDYSEPHLAFSHMPMGSAAEASARLAYGERALERVADEAQLARVLDGSLAVAVGVAVVPVYLIPNDFDVDLLGAFVLVGGGISVIAGLFSLLAESEAER